MHSSDSNSDSDFNGESFIARTEKQSDRRKILTSPIKHYMKQASRRPTASESRTVDNEEPSTSRQIFDNQNFVSTRPKNSKRKSLANNELHKNSKIQRLAPNHASQSLSHSEDSANTSSDEANLVKSPQLRGNVEARTPSLNHEETYPASGLKQSLHGVVYQLKHLMLVLNRAREMGYSFRLATEMDAAEKFDDLVLQYQNNTGDKVYRFEQLKHRQDGSQSIKASDLLADTDGAFSVKKYFISWRKIKQNSVFSESILGDFILCTNIGLDIEELEKADIGVSRMREQDDFLTLKDRTEQPPRYKLVVNKHSELYDQFKTTSDIHQLAQVLAQRVRDSQKLDLRTDIFKRYHVALAQEVIDVRKNRFSDNFIKNNLSATAERFRDVFSKQLLSNEHASENDIRKRLEKCKLGLSDKFGKNLPSTNESELKQVTELPNDQIEDADISDFLNVFTIAVDQPNEIELGEMIKRELGDNSMFNLLDANLVGDSFQNDILKWFKEKSGVFLKEENVQAFFKEIEVKLSSIMTMGLNLDYLGMLKKYDISFERQNRDLLNFLDGSGSTQKPILQLFCSKQGLVTALRVQQTLKETEKYNKADSFIFMRLKKLLPTKTTETVLRAFKNPRNHNLLVIECGLISEMPDTHRLWNQLDDAIANNVEKKMILIIQGNVGSAVVHFKNGTKISQEKDNDICIDNLKKSSRQKLLKRRVIKFQGREERTSFANLLSIHNFDDIRVDRSTELSRIIDVDTLVRLIREEEILIGSAVKGLGEIEDYYIPRTIVRHGIIRDNILDEEEFAERNEQGKIIVLSDAAGMGKSTVLTDLARKMKQNEPDMLVIRIDLTQNTHVLDKEQLKRSFDNNDTNGAVDFLVDKLSSITNDIESQVFKTIIKDQGNAALLFDGFDEISPTYANTVIDLLQALSGLRIKKLFVTTRPHANEILKEQEEEEGKFALALYTLRPFSVENQHKFLYKFWKRGLSPNSLDETTAESLQNHAQDVINLLAGSINDPENRFTGIPLQTRLVAENFPYPSELPKKTNIIDLYRGFVSKKYDVFCTEKKCADRSIPAVMKSCERDRRIFLITHQKFALDSLFDEETVRMLLSSQPGIETCLTLLQDVIEGGERTGIVTEVIEGKPHFIHRTFAEYFAAEFLSNTLKDNCQNQHTRDFFLEKLFVEPEYMTVRSFMNYILPDVSNAPKNEPWQLRLRENLNGIYGTVFHIAARERHIRIISFFLNCTSETLLNIQNNYGRTPLHEAVQEKDNLEVVKYLVQKGADINSLGEDGRTVLHDAVHGEADLDVVKYLLEKGVNIASLATDGSTVLHDAVRERAELNVVKYLLEKGANINCFAKDGRTVLHDAVYGGADLDTVKYLLDQGSDINSLAKDSRSVLHDAVHGAADLDVVKYLLEKGANINCLAKDGRTVLHDAVGRWNGLVVVKHLLDKGADINSLAKDGRTVLHYAVGGIADLNEVKYLLEKGANIHSLAKDGRTVLHDAVRGGADLDVVKYLLDKGADINSLAKDGRTVLHDAVRGGGDLDLVKYLLDEGADINSLAKDGRTVLHDAVRKKADLDVVMYLLEKGADINSLAKDGRTVLHDAVRGVADLEVVKYLLDQGADINAVAKDGRTVLHDLAGLWNDLNVMMYLLDKGADINFLATDGRTVLHDSVGGIAELDEVKYLLGKGADIHSLATDGRTVLHDAVRGGADLDVVKYLVNKGININSLAEDGRTVLHDAVRGETNLDVVKYLLDKGADVNSLANDGRTVLHDATVRIADLNEVKKFLDKGASIDSHAEYGMSVLDDAVLGETDLDVVKYLIDKGADIHSLAKDGRTVLHDAVRGGADLDVVKYLIDKGAGINSLAKDGRTLFYDVARGGADLDVVKYLIDKGVDIHSLVEDGRTVLHDAVHGGADLDVVKYLIDKGAGIHCVATDGRTVLHDAARGGAGLDVVKYLIDKGASIHCVAKDGRTVLHDAARGGADLDVVKYLIDKGADIHSLLKDGRTVLHDAVRGGADLDVVKYLLENGVDIISLGNDGRTVLHDAVGRGTDLDVVQYLLEKGALINFLAEDGRTPLHDAISGLNNFHSVPSLFEAGADFNSLDEDRTIMLHNAIVSYRNFEVVDYLLKQGANINSPARDGRTPLHDAVCRLSYLKLAKHLSDVGINTTWLAGDCRKPLHDAINRCGNLDVVQYLLKNGAEPNSRENEGFTPLHFAVDEACGLIKYISDKSSIDIRNLDHSMIWEVVIFLQTSGADATLRDNLGRTPRALAESLIGNLDIYQQVFHKFSKSEHPIQLQRS